MHPELPTETQCQIIRLLDPVTLISLSQTNGHFRRLINPQKKHLAERLLQLELLTPGLTFRSRDSKLEPEWDEETWEPMRWACTDCLRLLSHKHFDNHSILRLGYRKPIPGSPAAEMLTTWEQPRHIRDSTQSLLDKKQRRARHRLAVTSGFGNYSFNDGPETFECFKSSGMVGIEGMSLQEFNELEDDEWTNLCDVNALLIEREDCGKKRFLRKCNECRFRASLIHNHDRFKGTRGTRKFPIVPTRKVVFVSAVDRFFPGFSEQLKNKRAHFSFPVGSIYQGNMCALWTMWMARCPRCERWQEIREFRISGSNPHWKPPGPELEHVFEKKHDWICCIKCKVKSTGRKRLGECLSILLFDLIRSDLISVSIRLSVFCFVNYTGSHHLPKDEAMEWESILEQGPPPRLSNGPSPRLGSGSYILTYEDIALFNLRRQQWGDLLERAKRIEDNPQKYIQLCAGYNTWVHISTELEQHWRWLMGCKEEIEENPELLANWALNRDGASFT